ncbi:MAG: hypothetical protein U1E77_00285 [Inhella sp.]
MADEQRILFPLNDSGAHPRPTIWTNCSPRCGRPSSWRMPLAIAAFGREAGTAPWHAAGQPGRLKFITWRGVHELSDKIPVADGKNGILLRVGDRRQGVVACSSRACRASRRGCRCASPT